MPVSTRRVTSPPCPPLPPSGPPSGLNFSRRMEAAPFPPLPPRTCSVTRSMKVDMRGPFEKTQERNGDPPLRSRKRSYLRLGVSREDLNDPAASAVSELDVACGQREQRVVAAFAYAAARVDLRATLADEDLPCLDILACEPLHTEALGIGVTAVTG